MGMDNSNYNRDGLVYSTGYPGVVYYLSRKSLPVMKLCFLMMLKYYVMFTEG